MSTASNIQLDLFRDNLPHKPFCSNNPKELGLKIRNQDHALKHSHVQYNPPPAVAWLVFDVDHEDAAVAWMDADLPPPAWVSINSENGHAHIAYGISTPVCRTEFARSKPLKFLMAIEKAYKRALKADDQFKCLVTKNPLHKKWKTYYPISSNGGVYELHELAEYVVFEKYDGRKKKQNRIDDNYGLGRNCALFEDLRIWSYSAVRDYWGPGGYATWLKACEMKARELNVFDTEPLPESEVRASYKSVARWVWKNITPTGLQELIERTHAPELQAQRGRKSGVVRANKAAAVAEQARALRSEGLKQKDIADALNISIRTVKTYLKKCSEPISDNSPKDGE